MSTPDLTVMSVSGRKRIRARIHHDNNDPTRLFMSAAGSAFTMTPEQAIAVANRIADVLEERES